MTEAKQQAECEICWKPIGDMKCHIALTQWSGDECSSDVQMTLCSDCHLKIQHMVIQYLHQHMQEAVRRLEQRYDQPI